MTKPPVPGEISDEVHAAKSGRIFRDRYVPAAGCLIRDIRRSAKMSLIAAEVDRDEPRFKSVILKMDGEFYRLLIGTLRSHASCRDQGVVDSGTAANVLAEIERAIGCAAEINWNTPVSGGTNE